MEWQRRSRRRVSVHYPVQLHSDDNMGAGTLLNLSPAGCQVRSSLSLETGTYLAVHITVPDQGRPVAVELSVVRWHHEGRYGLEFVRYGHGDRDRLVHLTGAGTRISAGGHAAQPSEHVVPEATESMVFAGSPE